MTTLKIHENGDRRWYNSNDKLHRVDGPAMEDVSGGKRWLKDGKYHREDGPACEWSDGYKAWCLNGREYTESEFKKVR